MWHPIRFVRLPQEASTIPRRPLVPPRFTLVGLVGMEDFLQATWFPKRASGRYSSPNRENIGFFR
jgi:hypothetical protein